jgi:hypothetical protein
MMKSRDEEAEPAGLVDFFLQELAGDAEDGLKAEVGDGRPEISNTIWIAIRIEIGHSPTGAGHSRAAKGWFLVFVHFFTWGVYHGGAA